MAPNPSPKKVVREAVKRLEGLGSIRDGIFIEDVNLHDPPYGFNFRFQGVWPSRMHRIFKKHIQTVINHSHRVSCRVTYWGKYYKRVKVVVSRSV
ncbi:MAG: hypothetical protein ACFFAZ_15810 [Promethearchaeota archaeon]